MEADVWRLVAQQQNFESTATQIMEIAQRECASVDWMVHVLDLQHGSQRDVVPGQNGPAPPRQLSQHLCDDARAILDVIARASAAGRSRSIKRLARLLGLGAVSNREFCLAFSAHSECHGILRMSFAERIDANSSVHGKLDLIAEALSTAIGNDGRAAARAAADADRSQLLRKLGRADGLNDPVIGEQSGLRLVLERVATVSHSDVPVLLLGETGTGKELVARVIHSHGSRQNGPIIRINCGAIPRELIDSQLFGHERGSFTGATDLRQGVFERAHRGTLFLDEVGELPQEAQVRLLRVLQDGMIERVGGQEPFRVDVRIIAATHRDLAGMVRDRLFREDLWYRLAVFPILLPPLRERTEDIPELANYFAQKAATKFCLPQQLPGPVDIELLQDYSWPGNIREFATVIDRAALLGNGRGLEIAAAMGLGGPHTRRMTVGDQGNVSGVEIAPLADVIRNHITHALRISGGQIEGAAGAARLLGINPHTLRARMRKLNLDWSAFRA